jgi:hypothetical protein
MKTMLKMLHHKKLTLKLVKKLTLKLVFSYASIIIKRTIKSKEKLKLQINLLEMKI